MIRSIIIVSMVLLTQIGVLAQDYDAMTNDVRKKFMHIRENIDIENTVVLDEVDADSKTTGYFIEGKLSLIESIFFDETGKNVIEYYFDDEMLVFSLVQHINYLNVEQSSNLPSQPLDYSTESETRFYFNQDSLFLWLDIENQSVDLSDPTNSSFGKRIVMEAHRIKNQLNK